MSAVFVLLAHAAGQLASAAAENLLGLHITTVDRRRAELEQAWRDSARHHLDLTPQQAAMVLRTAPGGKPAPAGDVLIGFPAGNRRGVADGWKSSR